MPWQRIEDIPQKAVTYEAPISRSRSNFCGYILGGSRHGNGSIHTDITDHNQSVDHPGGGQAH
jgi:hypothetical protein